MSKKKNGNDDNKKALITGLCKGVQSIVETLISKEKGNDIEDDAKLSVENSINELLTIRKKNRDKTISIEKGNNND